MSDLSHLVSMPQLRDEVDRLDRLIVAQLAARSRLIDRAAEIKAAQGLAARLPDRVAEVVGNVRAIAGAEGLDANFAEAIWRQIIDWSIAREEAAMARPPSQDE